MSAQHVFTAEKLVVNLMVPGIGAMRGTFAFAGGVRREGAVTIEGIEPGDPTLARWDRDEPQPVMILKVNRLITERLERYINLDWAGGGLTVTFTSQGALPSVGSGMPFEFRGVRSLGSQVV